jgi:hypothetical protein
LPGIFPFDILNVWDLNLIRPIKFKSKPYPLTPLIGHQPTGPRTPDPARFLPFSLFLFSSPHTDRPNNTSPAHRREASRALSPSLRPGQLTGGSHPSAFPFLSPLSLPALSPARTTPPRRPAPRQPPTARFPFPLFLPRRGPRSLASPANRAPLSPLRDSSP